MGNALTGPVARAAGLAADYSRLATTVADGASRCHCIVECITLARPPGQEMVAALEYRLGCIGDLAVSLGPDDGQAPGAPHRGTGTVSFPASSAVAAALSELKTSIARATCVLEEGTRLRNAQRAILADIQASLRSTERHVCRLAADTNILARQIAGVVADR